MEKLTNKQQRIYDYIKKYIEEYNIPPTIREICDSVGLTSSSTVHTHLANLEKKGYIIRKKSKNRHIEITEKGFYESKNKKLPVLKDINYGKNLFSEENISGYFLVPGGYLKGEDNFIFKVRDSSMSGLGICENDFVIAKRQNLADDGDIVAAVADSCIICRKFFKEEGKYVLMPENEKYMPLRLNDVLILGKVTAVFRNF
ncbi:MAG: transcriptional repressor LexA [Clostridiales bacterium]|nr:transcriptional repressor LexA [Clostridiales bacterium]